MKNIKKFGQFNENLNISETKLSNNEFILIEKDDDEDSTDFIGIFDDLDSAIDNIIEKIVSIDNVEKEEISISKRKVYDKDAFILDFFEGGDAGDAGEQSIYYYKKVKVNELNPEFMDVFV